MKKLISTLAMLVVVAALIPVTFAENRSFKQFKTAIGDYYVDPDNTIYATIDSVLYSKAGKVLLSYPKVLGDSKFIIPEGITKIGKDAFADCRYLKTVRIPDTVTEIEAGAFKNCSSLEDIELPESICIIGTRAFQGCSSLKKINIPNNIEKIGSRAFGDTGLSEIVIDQSNPYYCTSMGILFNKDMTELIYCPMCSTNIKYKIPAGVLKIKNGAFQGCKFLNTVVLPETITKIEGYAFADCYNLCTVKIPDSVTHINSTAFENDDPRMTLMVNHESYASAFAKEEKIRYTYPDSLEWLKAE